MPESGDEFNRIYDSTSYGAPLWYILRLAGIEEGAHALFWNIKKESEKGRRKLAEAQESAQRVYLYGKNDETTLFAISDKHFTELTKSDILELLTSEKNGVSSFEGNTENAVFLTNMFLRGAAVPISRVCGSGFRKPPSAPKTRFGFMIPTSPKNEAVAAFNASENIFLLNRSEISLFSTLDDMGTIFFA